jgi:hypothetical protein
VGFDVTSSKMFVLFIGGGTSKLTTNEQHKHLTRSNIKTHHQ